VQNIPVVASIPASILGACLPPGTLAGPGEFLIDQTECPVSNPPPMTMSINIPERVLLINVARMSDLRGGTADSGTSVPKLLQRLGLSEN
jgi:LytTR family transcriptional regulator, CO-responsive transcriptional regulator RcoM